MSETERDAYELDTTLAEKNLQAIYDSLLRVEGALRDNAEAAGEAEQGSRGMAAAVFAGNLAFEAAKIAAKGLFDQIKEGVGGVIAAERATAQLRIVAGDATEALTAQAEALEHTFGTSAETVQAAQAALLRFGVSASNVDSVTRAINDYATATGKDLLDATNEVTRAVENGGGKLENLGITFKSTGRAAHDMAAAAEALGKKFGGSAEAEASTLAGRTKLAEIAFDDLRKSFGGLVVNFATQTGIIEDLRIAFEGLNIALFGSEDQERWDKLGKLYEQQSAAIGEIADAETDLKVARLAGDGQMEDGARAILQAERENLKVIKEQIAALTGRNEIAKEAPKEDRETKAGINEREDEEKKAIERRFALLRAFAANEKEVETKRTEALKVALAIRQRDFEESEGIKNRIYDFAITERERKERRFGAMSTAVASEMTKKLAVALSDFNVGEGAPLSERLEGTIVGAIRAVSGSRVSQAYAQSVVQPMLDTLKGAAMQIADVVAFEPLREFLTSNQTYKEEFLQASIERRQAELAEQGIIKTTSELRKEAEAEAAAAQQKRLAETLAQIAIEAGKQALFQVAEGIGNLAAYNYPAAALNFAAAAAYGVIAGASGGAAYAISQSRGKTSEERESIESLKRRDDAKAKREGRQRSTGGEGVGTQVNVYNLGITGQTRTAQARELTKIQREYGALAIGG